MITGASAFKVKPNVTDMRIAYNALALYIDHLFDMRSTRWHYTYMVPRYIDHLSTKYLRALQLRQVDRLLHLVLVAVSLVGGTPFIILNAILLTLIKKSGQPY